MHHCNEAQFSPWLLLLLTLQIRIVLQSLVKAGKCQAPGDAGATLGYQTPTQSRAGVTWVLPACECCQSVPVLLSTFSYECWGHHLHLGENCVLCFLVSCSEVHQFCLSTKKKKQTCGVFFVFGLFFFLNFNSLLSKYRQLNNCFTS